MLKGRFLDKLSLYFYNIGDIRTKYKRYKALFFDVIDDITSTEKFAFADRYTRIRHIYDTCDKLTPEVISAIHTFEVNATKVIARKLQITVEEVLMDTVALARFIICVTGEVPANSFAEIVNSTLLPKVKVYKKREKVAKIRIVVDELTDTHLCGWEVKDGANVYIRAKHGVKGVNDAMLLSASAFKKGVVVNLIDCVVLTDDEVVPTLFILYPDYLLDCSALAEACTENMVSPFNYLYSKVKKSVLTPHILLGDVANHYHDAFIYGGDNVEYREVTNDAFRTMPIEFTSCRDLDKPLSKGDNKNFFDESMSQFNNIGNVVNNVFPLLGIERESATLEPMFISEEIGVQGRLDLLHRKEGQNIVVEMKSGKGPYMSNTGVCQNHQSQAFLYQIMVQKVLGIPFHELETYIFYSRYKDTALRKTYPTMRALSKILNLRNRIVSMEYALASMSGADEVKRVFSYISPQYIINDYEKRRNNVLYRDYIIPQINEFRLKLDTLPPLDQKYIYSFASFIFREQMYAKVGGGGAGGFSSLWNSSLDDKMERGEILFDLTITSLHFVDTNNTGSGITGVSFKLPSTFYNSTMFIFRKGDSVVLYERNTDDALVTNREVLKCTIAEIKDDSVTVALRQVQKNKHTLSVGNKYAIEPDCSDSGNALLRSVFSLADTDVNRRDIILGKTLTTSHTGCLLTDITDENVRRVVTKAKSADDYFLLVGPPGTGKTSVTLRDMVKEFHAEKNNILLLAYTNRAVDEICASVKSVGIDFIRIGNKLTCADEFHSNLLEQRIGQCKDRKSVRDVLTSTQVYVATTTQMSRRSSLFDIMTFDVAIIDEASQILEPQICGILGGMNSKCELAIKKFIMIGDHKQLSAVVVQSEDESRVPNEDAELYEIGLKDRRNSLFERLYRLNQKAGNDAAYDMLTRQGRMHKDVAEFTNMMFYDGKLECVPLAHQECELDYKDYNQGDSVEAMIATKRIAFLPSSTPDDLDNLKTNPVEADNVVNIVVKAISLLETNGIAFTNKSIGIITTYRSQIALIRSKLEQYRIDVSQITIDTVERYQGSQRDIIIYSVCANEQKQLTQICNISEEDGVIIDRKLNVALTRARKQMFITGNPNILMTNPVYAKLINFIKNK